MVLLKWESHPRRRQNLRQPPAIRLLCSRLSRLDMLSIGKLRTCSSEEVNTSIIPSQYILWAWEIESDVDLTTVW
jgi:hypothetical protein